MDQHTVMGDNESVPMEVPPGEPLSFAEEMPQFPGGVPAMQQYFTDNLRYPATDKEAGKEGKVYVGFTVARDGSVADVQHVRGVSAGLDREAVRLVKAMPKWTPGKQRGRPVPVRMTVPVSFKL